MTLSDEETRRLEALREYALIGSTGGPAYDDLCRLAAHLCDTPIAAISLTDVDQQWVIAAVGFGTGAIKRGDSICSRVAESARILVVPDARLDPRFRASPLVTAVDGIRFYAGVPLLTPAGVAVGTLCTADRIPREISPRQTDALVILARQAVAQMELHRQAKESELARRQSAGQEKMLRTIFDLEPECVKVVSRDGTLLRINPAGLAILEADEPAQLVGRTLSDFVLPEDRLRFAAAFERALSGGTSIIEFEITGLRGGRRTLESHAVPMREDDGDIRSVLAVTRDITLHRRADAALRLKERELQQAQKMEAVGRLTGGVAHDFNNLLTALVGFGELLLQEAPNRGPIRELATEMLHVAERATGLCRRLLAFSRRQPVRPELHSLGGVVADLQEMLKPLLGASLDVQVIAREGPATVRIDRNQLEQVVVNLAVNARDAMPKGGTLTIETSSVTLGKERCPGGLPPGCYATLRVRDTGIGMSPDVLSRLFEPFFTTKGIGLGTGLGLSIVSDIVREAGGYVDVSSLPKEGSVFTIYLPSADPPLENLVSPSAVREKKILVVAGAPEVRHLVRRMLESRGGYRVLEAGTGQDALRELSDRGEEIRLLLLDEEAPGVRGADLAVRAKQLRPNLKILRMLDHPETAEETSLRPPIDGNLAKPFTLDGLLRAIEDALPA